MDITWFSPQKLEKMNWMEQNNESAKFHRENTLCVSNNFATWMEVNTCLMNCQKPKIQKSSHAILTGTSATFPVHRRTGQFGTHCVYERGYMETCLRE